MNAFSSDIPEKWLGKRYYSLDAYCKTEYHEKLYKIAIDAGLTCPNRDGTLDTRGCIFCSAGGSGDFAVSGAAYPTVGEQLRSGLSRFRGKKTGTGYIAYFQAYTNTYGDPAYLRNIFSDALCHPDVRGISIATRPDCLPGEILTLLSDLKSAYPDKFIWIELGLQTIHEDTARLIRRGYELPVFLRAVKDLHDLDIPVIVHVIIGLPGEDKHKLLETVSKLNTLPVWGVKLQLLHVLKGTDLAALYWEGRFFVLSKEAYIELLVSALEHLSPRIVVHRLTGDGPKGLTLAPSWSLNKRDVLNSISRALTLQNTLQGRYFHE